MWSTEHATNYMEFTGPLEFTIKPEFQTEDGLISAVNEFRTQFARGERDMEDYHNFLRQFSDYINVEKPSFGSICCTYQSAKVSLSPMVKIMAFSSIESRYIRAMVSAVSLPERS